jgi:hypothetical protein
VELGPTGFESFGRILITPFLLRTSGPNDTSKTRAPIWVANVHLSAGPSTSVRSTVLKGIRIQLVNSPFFSSTRI